MQPVNIRTAKNVGSMLLSTWLAFSGNNGTAPAGGYWLPFEDYEPGTTVPNSRTKDGGLDEHHFLSVV